MTRHTGSLLCVATLVLAACGGGGGGGAMPQTSDDTTGGSTDENPIDSDASVENTTPDDESLATATDRICSSHTTTTQSKISNSVFAFDADPGQCFGVKQAMGDGKRLIPTQLIENSNGGITGVLSIEPQGRLTINPYESSLGEGVGYTFNIDVTNTGSQTACVESPLFAEPFAKILDQQGNELGSVRMRILGDVYQAPSTGGPRVFLGCIPAGESRLAVGNSLDADAEIDPDIIASYDRVELPFKVDILSTDAERAADLSPGELSWKASSLENETSFTPGGFTHTTTVSVRNPSTQNTRSLSSAALVTFFDVDGYITDTQAVWVDEFLGIDRDEITPEDLTIAPAGGMLSFLSEEGFIANVDGRPDGYRGPATRALLHVTRCFDDGCTE